MSSYLLISKGKKHYYNVGRWCESLTTIRKNWECQGIDPNIFVLEKKYPYGGIYRLKKRIEGKWVNSKWIDTTKEEYTEPLFLYVEENMDKFISYREHEIEEWGEAPSMGEWVHRNEMAIIEFIFWMYDNKYIKVG